jgi:hypothetical protein
MLHRLIILTAKNSRILLGIKENFERGFTKKRVLAGDFATCLLFLVVSYGA